MVNKKQNSKLDFLIILGVVLAPMTGLRIWKIGPGELLVLLWCLVNSYNNKNVKYSTFHLIFWILFILCILIGTLIGIVYYPQEVIPLQVTTYIYLMVISLGTYIGLMNRELAEVEYIIERISVIGILWNVFLYIYSLTISPFFLNANLWYGNVNRFSGGGINPHQLAVFLGAIIFICYRNFLKYSGKKKIYNLILIILGLFIANETASSTLIMSIVITAGIAVILKIITIFNSYRDKLVVFTLLIVLGVTFMILNYNNIMSNFIGWVASDPNGLGRLEIFSSITDSLSKSFLFGLGPGNHAFDGAAEYHNTYLEILAMCGVVGFIIFIPYNLRVIKNMMIDYSLFLIVLPLYIYGLAGFAMRRLVYWEIFMIVVVISEKKLQSKQVAIK